MSQHESQVIKFSDKNQVFEHKILHLYAFKDKKLNEFLPPSFAVNDEDFLRQAASVVNFSNSLICKFPEDYDIYCLGSFSQNTGIIISLSSPEFIVNCSSLKTNESVRYDDLLKEIKNMSSSLSVQINQLDDIKLSYKTELKKLQEKGPELYNPVPPKVQKKNIISMLFNKF